MKYITDTWNKAVQLWKDWPWPFPVKAILTAAVVLIVLQGLYNAVF